MPAVPTHVHPRALQRDTLLGQTAALFLTGRAGRRQAELAVAAQHPVPGQPAVGGQLRQRAADPACGAAQAGEGGQLAVADHPARRNARQGAIERGLASTNQALQAADQNVRLLASGQEIATHDVMISLEDARMQLMLLSEVRNRMVEAYQELSRMQL